MTNKLHRHARTAAGFSAVELLVTLFVAIIFLSACYALYTAVIDDGGSTRARARASAIASEQLDIVIADNHACQTTRVLTPAPPSDSKLDNPVITATITAPYGCPWTDKVKKVNIRVQYGPNTNRQEVNHAMFRSF
ncbi:hypothetical protein FJZ39_03185 [Candidatus Saccharibacteria bacterium]|nr:hypothetical protein [Candidatus Saccharibacteria bacterium]